MSDDQLAATTLTLDAFDDALPDDTLSRANVSRAVVAGCRRTLLTDRRASLDALRDGFTLGGKLDLGLQLAQHRNADLALLLQGKAVISAQEMLDCFEWGEPPAECAAAVGYLRAAIAEGEAHLDVRRRRLLLRFCTGLNALPVNGLSRKVSFNFLASTTSTIGASGASGDKPGVPLPEPHTCTHELDLPAYSSRAELLEKLLVALDSFEADPSFGQE